ncbi:MATE family efflux transporter [Hathewaya limosa]|uniref:Multidrug export protein MepA n=1 Tax=Hathewaya limosa TaxID=1536 RepID=A0ABU0JP24_HATLI|nr:MATE family efflux transporter [Hathewaya limosa]MDQ0478834.1 putative MATE family efflux protein [Hathewaya limosa]
MKDTRGILLKESPIKLMFKLSAPAILGMIVIGLYSFMDGVFAGQMIGENAMGAISVAYPLTLFNSGISTLIGIGSASVLSRAIGKKDQEVINKIMGNLIALVLIFSIAITLIGVVFTRQLLQFSGAKGEILELAIRYLKIVYLGSIFVNFAQSANMVMRGEGLMKNAMLIMAFGAILNIVLDPILIKALGNKGIEGAAIATVTSQIVQAIITLRYFLKKSRVVKIHRIKIDKQLKNEVFSVGVSAMMMQVLTIIQQTLLYRMAFKYGDPNQAILMGASLRIQAFSFIPLWGMSQGLQPLVGTNYGAKYYDRVKKSTNMFIIGSTILALIFWIPMEIFAKGALGLFITNENIVAKGISNFRIFYGAFPIYGLMIMMITFFQSIGKGKNAGILVFLRQIIAFVPAIILMPKFFGIKAVWFTQPLVDTFVVLLGIILLIKEYKSLIN